MRPSKNTGPSGRRNSRRYHRYDAMAKHVDAVMKRAEERRAVYNDVISGNFKNAPQRLTQPISPHKRMRERAGLWMFAKQSEVIAQPNVITSAVRRQVQKDVRAVMAEDTWERRRIWNRVPSPAHSANHSSHVRVSSLGDGIFDVPGGHSSFKSKTHREQPMELSVFATKDGDTSHSHGLQSALENNSKFSKKNEALCLFPADPSMFDYAERILSALPPLPLRNGDPRRYAAAATGIVACSLRRQGILSKDAKCQPMVLLESARKNDTDEKFWRSFFEDTSPLESMSTDPAFFMSRTSSSPTKNFEQEDISVRDHPLSSSGDANTDLDNMPGCDFSDFFQKIRRNAGTVENTSVDSNDPLKLTASQGFPAHDSEKPEFKLDEFSADTVRAWFEKDSERMATTSANYSAYGADGDDMAPQSNQLAGRNFESVNAEGSTGLWLQRNSPARKKLCPRPRLNSRSGRSTFEFFDSASGSQRTHFTFNF